MERWKTKTRGIHENFVCKGKALFTVLPMEHDITCSRSHETSRERVTNDTTCAKHGYALPRATTKRVRCTACYDVTRNKVHWAMRWTSSILNSNGKKKSWARHTKPSIQPIIDYSVTRTLGHTTFTALQATWTEKPFQQQTMFRLPAHT